MAEVDLGIPGLTDFKRIGAGGFAKVYSAFEADAGRRVAVKVLESVDEAGRRSFDRERLTMGQTTAHDNIVTMFRSGYTSPETYPYLVLEHMTGGSLQDRLATDGPLPLEEAVDAIVAVAHGLGFAHSTGIVHKDIKPANILISPTGVVKLTDFGIASIRHASGVSQLGYTLAYSAPETFTARRREDGRTDDPRDERSDLYSLAVTLYVLVAGRLPFEAHNEAGLLTQILSEPAHPTGDEALDAYMAAALAKDPAERPATAAAFIDATMALVESSVVEPSAPPTQLAPSPQATRLAVEGGAMEEGGRASVRSSPLWPLAVWQWWVVALTAALVAVVGFAVLQGGDDATSSPTTPTEGAASAQTLTTPGSTTDSSAETADGLVTRSPAASLDVPITYRGHNNNVLDVIELDGGLLASTSSDSTVRIWDPSEPDATTGTYAGHTDFVLAAIELDNGLIASSSSDETVHIWDPDNPNTTIGTYTGHTGLVIALTQLDNGLIASAGSDETVQIWDPDNPATTIGTYTGHTDRVVALAPLDGGLIASGSWDDTVHIWDPENPDLTIDTYTGHTDLVEAVTQLDNGLIASAGSDETVHIWDPDNSNTTIDTYTGHTDQVSHLVQFDNGLIASASWDDTVHIWDPDNPDTTIGAYAGHTSNVSRVAELDNGLVASASADGTVQIWDPDNP